MNAFGAAMLAGDMTAVSALLRPDVTFSSPAVFQPYRGRTATLRVLAAAAQTFEDFAYTAEMHGPQVDVLRFRARVGRFELEGVDILTTGEDGQITDITVMVRPLRALEALMAAMQQALARQQDSDFLWKMAPGSRGPASHLSPTLRIRPWVWMRHPAHPIVQGATFIPQKSLKPGGQVPPGRAPGAWLTADPAVHADRTDLAARPWTAHRPRPGLTRTAGTVFDSLYELYRDGICCE